MCMFDKHNNQRTCLVEPLSDLFSGDIFFTWQTFTKLCQHALWQQQMKTLFPQNCGKDPICCCHLCFAGCCFVWQQLDSRTRLTHSPVSHFLSEFSWSQSHVSQNQTSFFFSCFFLSEKVINLFRCTILTKQSTWKKKSQFSRGWILHVFFFMVLELLSVQWTTQSFKIISTILQKSLSEKKTPICPQMGSFFLTEIELPCGH